MHATITKSQFELQTAWFITELKNMSDEDSNKQPAPHLNSIKWVAGHVLNTRKSLLSILTGAGHDAQLNKLFGKGSSGKTTPEFPTLPEINSQWTDVSNTLMDCLQHLPGETLKSSPPFQTSIPDSTMHGLIAYMVSHEAFHLGQLSVLKKLL